MNRRRQDPAARFGEPHTAKDCTLCILVSHSIQVLVPTLIHAMWYMAEGRLLFALTNFKSEWDAPLRQNEPCTPHADRYWFTGFVLISLAYGALNLMVDAKVPINFSSFRRTSGKFRVGGSAKRPIEFDGRTSFFRNVSTSPTTSTHSIVARICGQHDAHGMVSPNNYTWQQSVKFRVVGCDLCERSLTDVSANTRILDRSPRAGDLTTRILLNARTGMPWCRSEAFRLRTTARQKSCWRGVA